MKLVKFGAAAAGTAATALAVSKLARETEFPGDAALLKALALLVATLALLVRGRAPDGTLVGVLGSLAGLLVFSCVHFVANDSDEVGVGGALIEGVLLTLIVGVPGALLAFGAGQLLRRRYQSR